MKRPDGWVVEEYVTETAHLFERGERCGSLSDGVRGTYTGVFWFEYFDGRQSRRYTEKTAPAWLRAMYLEAVTEHARTDRSGD